MDGLLDEISNLDLGGRGAGALAVAARTRAGGSPLASGADLFARLTPGSTVLLTTGLAPRPWVSTAQIESDGPAGAIVLARVLVEALGLRVLLVAEQDVLPPLEELAVWSGVPLRPRAFPLHQPAAAARDLLRDERPAVLVSIERLGRNAQGVFHNSRGRDVGEGKAALDTLFELAAAERIPTLGVGDGGNEIGMGSIPDTVREAVPFARQCTCGCGGGIAAVTPTSVLLTGGTSNWAAYALADLLARRTARDDLIHAGDDEERLLLFGVELGLVNGMRGTVDPDVDAIPLSIHRAIADLLARAALLTTSPARPEEPAREAG
jgi:hypothetical protein